MYRIPVPPARLSVMLALALIPLTTQASTSILVNDTSGAAGGTTCTLRNAIASANAAAAVGGCRPDGNGSPVTIKLQPVVYRLDQVDNHWYGPNGLPAIATAVYIEGNGAVIERSTASGTPAFRLFFIGADPANPATRKYTSPGAGSLVLTRLTLRNGLARGGSSLSGGGGAGMGGAVFNHGELFLKNVTLAGNAARGGDSGRADGGKGGGGIGEDAAQFGAGGFGGDWNDGTAPGAIGGAGFKYDISVGAGGGGGAGFGSDDRGGDGTANAAGRGGGASSGLGGRGTSPGGDGGGAGGLVRANGLHGGKGYLVGAHGGAFGVGGDGGLVYVDASSGAGGGVGGGGGAGYAAQGDTSNGRARGGHGGFGGGGGHGFGAGGFGGGGGYRDGLGGFGGGNGAGLTQPASGGGGGGLGGAIFNHNGSTFIVNSTLTANQAEGGTALSRAHAGSGLGGAVFNLNGQLAMVHSTLSENRVDDDRGGQPGGGTAWGGGAIYHLAYDGAHPRDVGLHLEGNILANSTTRHGPLPTDLTASTARRLADPDLSNRARATVDAPLTSIIESMQVIGDVTVTGVRPLRADPKLLPLADNGGATWTMRPAAGSPAVDRLDTCATGIDQRFVARPQGGRCDIGSVELETR